MSKPTGKCYHGHNIKDCPICNPDVCPGRFKCHGPISWCDECGDVDLVCDDPNCEQHLRLDEKKKRMVELEHRFAELDAEHRSLKAELEEAKFAYLYHRNRNSVMVGRK